MSPSPAQGSDTPPEDSSRVIRAFRDAISSDQPPEVAALPALRAALGISGDLDGKLTSEQNVLVENGLRLLLQECVEAAADAGLPVLQFCADSTREGEGQPSGRDPESLKLNGGTSSVEGGFSGGRKGLDIDLEAPPADVDGIRVHTETTAAPEVGNGAAGTQDSTQRPLSCRGEVTRLLDAVLWLCESAHVEGGLVLQLLEDLLDCSVISDCKEVFAYIEAHQSSLAKDPILQRGKLVLLRTCNQLVRRLSKANDLVFCGRILMLLATLFPIAEKSAVNFRGLFNTANRTVYETAAPSAVEGECGPAFDFKFYSTFWSLQEFFCNPPTAASKWSMFSEALKTVLATFSAQPLAEIGTGDDTTAVSGELGSFNIKYLTSPNLLGLELKDHNFRRHVLLQCLFLLDFLGLPPPPNSAGGGGRPVERAKEREREERRAAMAAEVRHLQSEVRKLLGSIPPKAAEFLSTVDRVLAREQYWVQWKKDNCPPFDRAPTQLLTPADHEAAEKQRAAAAAAAAAGSGKGGPRGLKAPRRSLQQQHQQQQKRRSLLGNKELDELFGWALKHPDVLTDPDSASVPKFREFIQPLAEDMDPAAGVDDDIHRKNDRVFTWRALRLAARQDVDAFNRFDPTNGIEMVVPPDMLTEDVRQKLHKKPSGAAVPAATRPKKDASSGLQASKQPGTSSPHTGSRKMTSSPVDPGSAGRLGAAGHAEKSEAVQDGLRDDQGNGVKDEPLNDATPTRAGAKKRSRSDSENEELET